MGKLFTIYLLGANLEMDKIMDTIQANLVIQFN